MPGQWRRYIVQPISGHHTRSFLVLVFLPRTDYNGQVHSAAFGRTLESYIRNGQNCGLVSGHGFSRAADSPKGIGL